MQPTPTDRRRVLRSRTYAILLPVLLTACGEATDSNDETVATQSQALARPSSRDFFSRNKSLDPYSPENKWHHMNILRPLQNGELRWFVDTNCNDGFDARSVVRRAYAIWQPYVPFRFVEATSAAQANTVIRFVGAASFPMQDGTNMTWWQTVNGVTGVILGAGWRPHETLRGVGFDYWGDIFINDLARWNESTEARVEVTGKPGGGSGWYASSLLETLAHEIGHTLGLNHDDTHANNLMHNGGNGLGTGKLWDADITSAVKLYQMAYETTFGVERSTNLVNYGYRRVLWRDPDPSGMTLFRDRLLNNRLPSKGGTYDFKRFMIDLTSSEEAWNLNGFPDHYVNYMYYWMLDRWPSQAEVDAWLTSFPSQMNRVQLAEAFAYSAEFNERFVSDRLWTLLGNDDPSLHALYVGQLNRREITAQEVDQAIGNSKQYFDAAGNNANLVRRNYERYFERTPSSGEVDAWMQWID